MTICFGVQDFTVVAYLTFWKSRPAFSCINYCEFLLNTFGDKEYAMICLPHFFGDQELTVVVYRHAGN